MTASTDKPVLLRTTSLHKSFGSVEVLHGIDLELRGGEIHALLGENGAGKSTLVKLLCGFEPADSGTIQYSNESGELQEASQWHQMEAESQGVVLIHQEFNLAEQLSVVDNIFLGNELTRSGFLDKPAMRQQAEAHLRALNCSLDLDATVSSLAVSDKQMIEIARVQTKRLRVLILDEPTAVLTQTESAALFELLEKFKHAGVAIVFISHKLDEIAKYTDHITVLRDGEVVTAAATAELSKEDMIRHMVGRELSSLFPELPQPRPEILLSVSDMPLQSGASASFDLRRGEILGFAGLVGSGRTALMERLVGLSKYARTEQTRITLKDTEVRIDHPATARKLGIAYLTKDRKGAGLLMDTGLVANFSLYALDKFTRVLIDSRKEQKAFDQAVETFDIRFKQADIKAGNLSGGNQQKLLLAKIMAADPEVLIIDEPTRGIDVGTKSQIYHFIAELTASGIAVILISSDITEIIGLSHRVAVMYHNELAGILSGADINEEEIMRYATGQKSQSTAHHQSQEHSGVHV